MKKAKLMLGLCAMGVICMLFACSKNEIDLSRFKTHYTMIPDSLAILPGFNRV